MLIPFYSKAAGDFFMQEVHVRSVFALMGKPFAPQGVISADELNDRIHQLTLALNAAQAQTTQTDAEPSDHSAAVDADQTVGLKQRAWPLLDMMQRAAKKNVDVMWGSTV